MKVVAEELKGAIEKDKAEARKLLKLEEKVHLCKGHNFFKEGGELRYIRAGESDPSE